MLLLPLLILLPLVGFVGCVSTPKTKERAIFAIAMTVMVLELSIAILFGLWWLSSGAPPFLAHAGSLYASRGYNLPLDFYFDGISAVFLGMATVMTTLILVFSRYYMHREPGFKRFYSTIFLFFMGLSLIILSGTFELLFMGWELIGISSVLLIAFYRDRFLPARNALKVFSVYRIADACLIAAIWYAHHLFEKNINFSEFPSLVAQHGNSIAVLGALLLIAALIKSAQFPFSYWLPRAMEGPTTSSAIFYGALSVHMGVYLLLRTFPLWEGSSGIRIAVAAVGLVTALIASSIARVQSSIKTQIAYASITQIGIMFIEVALGLQWLALLHFVSNASLRSYQLLISPSSVSYFVHDQFFYFVRPVHHITNTLLGKIRATLYVLGIKEWNMDRTVSRSFWQPLKSVGKVLSFLDTPRAQVLSVLLFVSLILLASTVAISAGPLLALSTFAACISIIFYIRAYATKHAATISWNLIMLGHLLGVFFLATASAGDWKHITLYSVGVAMAFVAGHLCLRYLAQHGEPNTLRNYHGVMYKFPRLGNFFFVIVLLFMAFPISPSFLAQDILLSMVPIGHAFQIVFFCASYLLIGVSCMRIYTKVFLGPHRASPHERAYKSA